MSFIKTTDNINMNSKVLAAGVIDANSSAQWYESRFLYESTVDSSKVWAEVDRLKELPAANRAAANTNVAANTDLFADHSTTGIRLTSVPGTSGTTWVAYETHDDASSNRMDGWIQPQMIPQANGAASVGYAVQIFTGGDSSTGTALAFTEGQTGIGADAAVSWIFNYSMGVLLFAPDAVPSSNEIWVYGYRYDGETGGGASSSASLPYCQVYDVTRTDTTQALTLTRNPTEPLDPGVRKIATEVTTVTLRIVWERLTESGLGFNSTLPTINGTTLTQDQITTTNFYDKIQYADVEYTIADGNITLGHNGETMEIEVETVTKPTATITHALPDLPWDSTTEQSEAKNGDIITITVNDASEKLDMVRVEGGDTAVLITDTTDDKDAQIETTDTDTEIQFTISNTTSGNRNLNVYVRAEATGAWSLATTFVVEVDNVAPTATHVVTYPAEQRALKSNEQARSNASSGIWDTATWTGSSTEVSGDGFSEDSATEWSISMIRTADPLTNEYRYDDVVYGTVQYRKTNGMEVNDQMRIRVSTELPEFIGTGLPYIIRHGEPAAEFEFLFDQPINKFAGTAFSKDDVIENGSSIPNNSLILEMERPATLTPGTSNITVNSVEGPSLLPAENIDIANAFLFNGFVQQTVQIPSGVRTGNIPIQVDLTNHRATFITSWDATEANTQLTAVFDSNLSGTKTADPHILFTQNANGTLNFEILFSDTTLLATTIRIEQTAQ